MKVTRVRGLTRSSRAGSIGACGLISSTCCRICASRSSSRASSSASSMARFSASFSARSDLRSPLAAVRASPARAAFVSLSDRDASMTASRSRCARSLASCRRVRAGAAAERDRLQQRQAVGDRVGAQHLHRGGHRPLGADAQPERRHQLCDVHPQHQVAGRDLTASQVRQVDRAGAVHQAATPRPASGARCAATEGLRPGCQARAHQLVGDLLVRAARPGCGPRCARRRASPRPGPARRWRSAAARWLRRRSPRRPAAPPAPAPGAATGGCGAG